jgi:hypothetical protein
MDSKASYAARLSKLTPEANSLILNMLKDPSKSHVQIAKAMNKAGHKTGLGGNFCFRTVSFIALHNGFRRKTGGPKGSYTRGSKPQQIAFKLKPEPPPKPTTGNERSALISLILEAKTISKQEKLRALDALME